MIWKIVAHFFLYNPKQPDYNDNLSVTKCYQIVWPVIVNLSVFPPLKRVVQKFEPHDSYSNREAGGYIYPSAFLLFRAACICSGHPFGLFTYLAPHLTIFVSIQYVKICKFNNYL
jgi:hypothetical protein